MNRNEILRAIYDLSKSQGFYGRLYRTLIELNTEDYEQVMGNLEEQNFKDTLDLVLFMEQ